MGISNASPTLRLVPGSWASLYSPLAWGSLTQNDNNKTHQNGFRERSQKKGKNRFFPLVFLHKETYIFICTGSCKLCSKSWLEVSKGNGKDDRRAIVSRGIGEKRHQWDLRRGGGCIDKLRQQGMVDIVFWAVAEEQKDMEATLSQI